MSCVNDRRLSLARRYQCEFGKPPPSWWNPDSTMEELTHWENWRLERMAKDFTWWEFVVSLLGISFIFIGPLAIAAGLILLLHALFGQIGGQIGLAIFYGFCLWIGLGFLFSPYRRSRR